MNKKSFILCLAMMTLPLLASAHDFEVDGIYYNITSETARTVAVTCRGDLYDSYSGEYSGSITIPATVTYNDAQYSVTSIGDKAFAYCSSLTSITIPESVTSIGYLAFRSCSSLTSINIPESATSIGEKAFSCCRNLAFINIPESVTSIGGRAFEDTQWEKDLPDGVVYINNNLYTYKGTMSENTSIEVRGGTISISSYAFSGCSSLTSINIPESVTSIGSSAFTDCSSLTSINIPESVTSIESYAFSGCSSLTTITLPEGVTSIGSSAFRDCSSLTTITLPEGVTSIENSAFYDCSSLTAITLPEGVTSIGSYAFEGCSSLITINIPESVTSIEEDAFSGCSNLTSVHISNIEAWCKIYFSRSRFSGNYSSNPLYCAHNLYLNGELVTELIIPESVTSIGESAFYSCESLTCITLPEGVTSIGDFTFNGCTNLTTINIPENSQLTSIGDHAFRDCSSLTAITLPESVTSIGTQAFYNCTGLISLHIGANVDKYGNNTFEGCTAIKELTIMGNVMPEIPSENLTSITLYSPIPLETKEFASKVYRNATLNIPEGSLTRYQNAEVWKNFWYINEFDPKKGKDIYLTINQADNGYVKQHLVVGTVCTFTIEAAEGWKIHTVTFNGEDVTSQLTEEGTFTTPALQDDAVLNIAYEKIDDTIESTRAGAIKVQGHQGTLRITGATEGTDISIYTTSGTLVTREAAEAGDTEITLPEGQVYIVKVADTVVKIGM